MVLQDVRSVVVVQRRTGQVVKEQLAFRIYNLRLTNESIGGVFTLVSCCSFFCDSIVAGLPWPLFLPPFDDSHRSGLSVHQDLTLSNLDR